MTAKQRKPETNPFDPTGDVENTTPHADRPTVLQPNKGAHIESPVSKFLSGLRGPDNKKTRKQRHADDNQWGPGDED